VAEPTTYPRPDFAHDLGDVRAWIDDVERAALDALACPDLASHVETRVLLAEHNKRGTDGRRRIPSRDKWTPEQQQRAGVASKHLEAQQDALLNARRWIYRIAIARRDGHAAMVDAKAVPS
jgi:hypothetical protein